tara:strand:- start:3941 stop:6361 length:2421 start_codon:yes stop_codon:yes gene_type:complete
MADILYIDCNRNLSIKSEENTNEWEFKLQDEALLLPAGTQVSIQESFINKKGVSGNTIEIEEDISTTIRYSYYLTHSPHFVPEAETRPDASTNRLFTAEFDNVSLGTDFSLFPRDALNDRGGLNEIPPAQPYFDPQFEDQGGYEKPMMACKISRYNNTTGEHEQSWAGDLGTIEPVIGTSTITIPAGSYGVDEISKLIEDQLTGRLTNVANGDFNENYIQKKIAEQTYRGTLENDTTLIMSTCMPFNLVQANGNPRTDVVNGYRQWLYNEIGTEFKLPLYGEVHATQPAHDPDTPNDRFRPLFFMKPSDWNDCRDTHMIVNEWNKGDFTPVDRAINQPPAGEIRQAAYLKRSEVWNYTKQTLRLKGTPADAVNTKPLFHHFRNVDASHSGTLESYNYDPQSKGIYVGAPEIKFGWDTTTSSFAISNLHFPYRFNSHDQQGNEISEAGQEGILLRRLNTAKRVTPQGTDPETYLPVDHDQIQDFETPMTRVGGIAIFNWDVETAKKYGSVNYQDGTVWSQVASSQNMWSFEDHFENKESAKRAWKNTLWSKLGFTYDQLQNRDNWEMANFLEESKSNNRRLFGATTRPDINTSIVPSVSSAFNIATLGPSGNTGVKPRVYTNMDLGTTSAEASNASSNNPYPQLGPQAGPFSNLGSYYSSPFKQTTTISVITQGRPIIAQKLPTLSDEGYYLITSNIIDGYKDRVKRGTPISLLGIVPISNLSNQDFIQSRNDIVHTIQNTTVLNSIKIKILNPDLTAPKLEDNSSVILKIIRPLQDGQGLIGDLGHTKEEDKHTDEKKSSLQKKKF